MKLRDALKLYKKAEPAIRSYSYNWYRECAKSGSIPVGGKHVSAYKKQGLWHVDSEELTNAINHFQEVRKRLEKNGHSPIDISDILTIGDGVKATKVAQSFSPKQFRSMIINSRLKGRRKALRRDNGRCVSCGKDKNLVAHHIFHGLNNRDYYTYLDLSVTRGSSFEGLIKDETKIYDHPLNLVTLCVDCHNVITPFPLPFSSGEIEKIQKFILGDYKPRKPFKGEEVAKAIRHHMRGIYGDNYSKRVKKHLSSSSYVNFSNLMRENQKL